MTSTLARQAMSAEPDRVAPTDTLQQDAATMRNLQVAYLPVCDDHGDPHGFIAQRDIDLRCLTDDGDPGAATAATLTQNPWATIGVDDPVDHAWPQVTDRQGPPLPVLVGRHLVGVIRPGDLTAAPAHPRPGRPETAGSAATIGGDALPTAGPNPAGVPLDPSTPRPLDPDSAGRPRSAPPEERPASGRRRRCRRIPRVGVCRPVGGRAGPTPAADAAPGARLPRCRPPGVLPPSRPGRGHPRRG